MNPTAIELFAGCGGLSTGLLDAGVQVRLGVDYYRPAVTTFAYNHEYRGARSMVADLREVAGSQLLEAAGVAPGELDLLAGGPPCQPFSIIGKRQALSDPRAEMVIEYLRLLGELSPAAFLFENVANLATVDGGSVLGLLLDGFSRFGYSVGHAVLNAADYGVPQNRKRLIIVGIRGACRVSPVPPPTHGAGPLAGLLPARTSRDAIGDLPDVDTPAALRVYNHEATHHSPGMVEAFERLSPGGRDPKSHHDRLHPDRPSYTLRAGTGNFSPLRPVHYEHDRVITVRESARIQSFSDDFIWPHTIPRLQQYRQVGNAVPPLLASALARQLGRQLGWDLDPALIRGDLQQRKPPEHVPPAVRLEQRQRLLRGASLGQGR